MSVYRTAQGKMIDMSSLATKNEKVRAVGNMNVNARGDTLDSNNQVINDNTKRAAASYQKTVQERVNNPAPARANPNRSVAQQQSAPIVRQHPIITSPPPIEPIELTQEEREFDDDEDDAN